MLNGKLVLHGVDVEYVCHWAIEKAGIADLSHHEREDLLAYLIAECWELSERFDPERFSKGFDAYAYITLKKRAVGWDQRIRRRRLKWQFADRTYERPAVHVDSIDRMGQALIEGEANGPDDSLADLVGVFREGGSAKPRQNHSRGEKEPGLAA